MKNDYSELYPHSTSLLFRINIPKVAQPDGQLQMARRDPPHLQVLGGVASQLENLVGEIQSVIRTSPAASRSEVMNVYNSLLSVYNLGGEILEDASTIDCRSTSDSPQPLFTLYLN